MSVHLVASGRFACVLAVAAEVAAPGPARGQWERVDGLQLEAAVAGGRFSCPSCSTSGRDAAAASWYVQFTERVGERLALGAQLGRSTRTGADSTGIDANHVMVIAQFYPGIPGVFARIGTGLTHWYYLPDDGAVGSDYLGFSLQLGGGYNLRVVKDVFVTPTVSWLHTTMFPTDARGERRNGSALQYGVGLTVR